MDDSHVIYRRPSANAHPTARFIWAIGRDNRVCGDCERVTENFALLYLAVCDHISYDKCCDMCIDCLTDMLEDECSLNYFQARHQTHPCPTVQRAFRAVERRKQSRAYRKWLHGAKRVALAGSLSRGSHRARVVGRDLGARIASFL
jgi:hypothetical protein